MDFWMLITHGLFGVGSIVGPFIVYIFEGQAYAIVGLITAAFIPWLMMKKSPELNGF